VEPRAGRNGDRVTATVTTLPRSMVRIAIVGTRGIPNRYGGFEQNAENLAAQFHDAGHDVTVFNPHDHPYKLPTWQGVKIRRRFWHERRLGALGIFLYDYLCLAAAFRVNFDIVLELGYAPSALYHFLRPAKGPKIITNMDGLRSFGRPQKMVQRAGRVSQFQ